MDNKLKPYNINSMRFNPPWYTPGNRQDQANNAWFGFIQMLTKMKYRRESLLRPLKLLEMGCLPGAEVQLVQIAPLKDPLYICVNGSHLAIRKETALQIQILKSECCGLLLFLHI